MHPPFTVVVAGVRVAGAEHCVRWPTNEAVQEPALLSMAGLYVAGAGRCVYDGLAVEVVQEPCDVAMAGLVSLQLSFDRLGAGSRYVAHLL